MKIKGQNIFTSLLYLLNVKYTESFSNRYYNEHPHKYNLFGISKMLDNYGIENAGTKIENKTSDLFNIQTPFIAHTSTDFVLVYRVSKESIKYRWNGKDISITPSVFISLWSGIILLVESSPKSIEPNYNENRRKELLSNIQYFLLLLISGFLFTLIFINNHSFFSLEVITSFFINIIGVFFGILLVKKQFAIQSRYSDKICSMFKQADCNNILESKASKLWGIFSWSEIGLSYFISNILIFLILPAYINYYAIINIFILPYSFWSIWYQKYKAKQWCVLCLVIQILLWAIFFTNLFFNDITISSFDFFKLIVVGMIYFISFILVNSLVNLIVEKLKIEQITQEISSIKADEDVFFTLLKKQQNYMVDKSTSNILLGNPNAKLLVTIFTNPHCDPCARMHKRVDKLVDQSEHLCIQYIYSSFNDNLKSTNKHLIAIYLNNKKEKARKIYTEWFEEGKFKQEKFLSKYDLDINCKEVNSEFQKHENWKSLTALSATPTILVNGYKLPDNYKIEDLVYFTSL